MMKYALSSITVLFGISAVWLALVCSQEKKEEEDGGEKSWQSQAKGGGGGVLCRGGEGSLGG